MSNISIDSVTSSNDFIELSRAGTYSGEQIKEVTKRKNYNIRRRKKKLSTVKDVDLEQRQSKAQQIQNRIMKGDTFMSKENKNLNAGSKIVGDAFTGWTIDTSDLNNGVKQPVLIKCRKEIGIDAHGVQALSRMYQLKAGRVSDFDKDSIATEEEFLAMYNTAGAVVMNWKVNKNWKINITSVVKDEEGKEVTKLISRDYKGKKDKFPEMEAFGHAINQFGVYKNDDLGICIEPVWVDFSDLGIVEPSEFEVIAQKVQRLMELSGTKNCSFGLACEDGCNVDFMTTSEEVKTFDDEEFIQYRMFYKYQNAAEMVYQSIITRRKPTKATYSEVDGRRVYDELPASRYNELYTYSMDRATLIDVLLRFSLSNLGK